MAVGGGIGGRPREGCRPPGPGGKAGRWLEGGLRALPSGEVSVGWGVRSEPQGQRTQVLAAWGPVGPGAQEHTPL